MDRAECWNRHEQDAPAVPSTDPIGDERETCTSLVPVSDRRTANPIRKAGVVMGTILEGLGDDAYEHEGYVAQVLGDGTLTGTCSSDTEPGTTGQVAAACGCGWAGPARYPTTRTSGEAAEELALAEWERDHVRPLLSARRAERWDHLQARLRRLAGAARAATPGARFIALPSADQLAAIDAALAGLHRATELARQLRQPLGSSTF